MVVIDQFSGRSSTWLNIKREGFGLADLDPRNNRPDDDPYKTVFQGFMSMSGITFEGMQEVAARFNDDPIDLKTKDPSRISLFDENEPDKLKKLVVAAAEGVVTYGGLSFDQWPADVIRQVVDAKQLSDDEDSTDDDEPEEEEEEEVAAAGDEQHITDDGYPFHLRAGQILRLDDDDDGDGEQPMDGGRIRKAAADKQRMNDGRPNKRLYRSSSLPALRPICF